MMRILIASGLLLALAAAGGDGLAWSTDFAKSAESAQASKRPMVVAFGAGWCRYCRLMKETVLPDAKVQQALSGFHRVTVDADKEPRLVAKYRAYGLPTYVRLDSEGRELARIEGYRDVDAFHAWLTAEISAPATPPDHRPDLEMLRNQINDLDPLVRLEAASEVLARCTGDDEAERLAATPLLRQVAGKAPYLIQPALNDERLAVRIVVANAFAEARGESFVFDPWAPAADRQQAAAAFEAELKKATP